MAFFIYFFISNGVEGQQKIIHQVIGPVCGALEHAREMQTCQLKVEEYFDGFLLLGQHKQVPEQFQG
jgi:hypothetical protein